MVDWWVIILILTHAYEGSGKHHDYLLTQGRFALQLMTINTFDFFLIKSCNWQLNSRVTPTSRAQQIDIYCTGRLT